MKNHCGSCRNCCRSMVRVSAEEIKLWKEKQRYDILLCLEEWPGGKVYLMQKDDMCIFLSEDGCSIYEERPKICRDFPLGEKHVEQFNCSLDPETKKPRT